MKTLVQTRNGSLQKQHNKKRKLDLCSLVMTSTSRLLKKTGPSCRNRKGKSTGKRLVHKRESNKVNYSDPSKKQNYVGFHGARSLCSSSKDNKRDSRRSQTQNLKRRRRRKKKKDQTVLDEASQLQRRARNLLVKLKLEQNLIDAYSGEGWKGQSREKIKPETELLRAKKQILKCKLGIRDTIHQLDLLGSVGQIDESLIAPDGSVHHEHIFCKKCKSQEVSEDNDIILCDGTCNCGFHQKCIDPPLATEDMPPEDEGWLCKYCDCKMEILDAMNAHLGTQFSVDSTWQDIFKEEALLSDVGSRDFNPEEEWPDDESDDNDYDPDADENNSIIRSGMNDIGSHEESSCSSLCSLESEGYSDSGLLTERNGMSSNISPLHPNYIMDFNDHEIVTGPRQRSAVDYRKLYDEMFGKDTSTGDLFSEDEDWGPPRKRRKKECDAASTLMTLCEGEVKHSDLQNMEVQKNHLPNSKARNPPLRIASDAVQKLRQAFAENELPSKDVKKEISGLLGLEYEKVDKWFKNARYMALKNRKANVELSDDMSLKKHLLHLKAKIRKRRRVRRDTDHSQVEIAESQMEQIFRVEAKLRKLKQILSTIEKANARESDDPRLIGNVVYVPIVELKEKL